MDVTLTELAQLTDGTIVRGKLDAVYGGMEALDLAGPGDVSFLGNAKYATVFATSKAGVCLVEPGERGGSEDMALIEVVNPTLAFSAVISHFSKAEAGFHPVFIPPHTLMLRQFSIPPRFAFMQELLLWRELSSAMARKSIRTW